ncbi:MAG: hypothetical protein HQK79_12725 [Desulfobacterales bacterium]|nr:hypothetical protein [Desulfobacterales bacterium]MBF0395948.1 hypothetical protein [Desulfobacterales bacterium]
MSCYFRHIKNIFDELGIEATKENKKNIDKIMHNIVNVGYKDCSKAWKAIKAHVKGDENIKNRFVEQLREKIKKENNL